MRRLNGTFTLLGSRFPVVAGVLVGGTLVFSILATAGGRGAPFLGLTAFVPGLVVTGQIWRLVTWTLIATHPIELIFAGLILLMMGRDLAYAWGPRRLLVVYFVVAAGSALVTSLLAFLWPDLMRMAFASPWPVAGAFIIAWAIVFPQRQLLMMFVIPLQGAHLVYGTLGLTLLVALMGGFAGMMPQFVAEIGMLLFMRDPSLQRAWLKLRYRFIEMRLRRRPSYIRPVDSNDRWRH